MSDTTTTDVAALVAELAALREQVATLAARPVRKAAAPKPVVPCVCASFASATGETTECEATTKATFAPGHDAKTKGLLLRAAIAGATVTDTRTNTVRTAAEVAAEFGFATLVADGVALHQAKAADKAKRAADRAWLAAQAATLADQATGGSSPVAE